MADIENEIDENENWLEVHAKMHHRHHRHHRHSHKKEVTVNAVEKLNKRLVRILHDKEIQTDCSERPSDGKEAWHKLKKGNCRFNGGNIVAFLANIAEETSLETRKFLVSSQTPFATILTCSDSRCSPELIFDQGLGQLFIIRAAGNVIDDVILGTVEYGVEHLKTPVLVLMGHQNCGAVKATCDSPLSTEESGEHDKVELGYIAALVNKILPAVRYAKKHHDYMKEPSEVANLATQKNIVNVKNEILAKSKVVQELVENNQLNIIPCVYSFESGETHKVKEERLPQ
eukprot:TRINITY_DN6368_c0_g1_i1.p1 TRINITY_DN6368_c0_g1~~TRINITY_DN6368_c0_g1_i1.p1  ORF type:complete len:287 (+),score=57.95 TRINITY_DN6368_c0_g1_i1:3-863(+)